MFPLWFKGFVVPGWFMHQCDVQNKNILTLLDRKHLPVIGINIQLGMTRVFNPIKKVLSSLSVVYQTVRLRKRFFSVLFYSELKQKNATLRERYAN